jgi:hypothetical protein
MGYPVIVKDFEEIMLILVFRQSLQASVQRVHSYVQTLEEQLAEIKKK